MSTSTVNQATFSSAAATAAAAKSTVNKTANGLNVSDFLTLMTTQLKNQDPFKPLDGTEMVAQLAQFGTVSGVQQMNTTLGTLSDSLRASQALSGATMVGHEIIAQSGTASFDGSTAIVGGVDVPAGASSATLTISDATGQVVRHVMVPTAAGQQVFKWDGKNDAGAQVGAGSYTLTATANVGGATQGLTTAVAARVTSVSLDSSGTGLTLNTQELGAVALNQVQQII
jgi:flagellar basal-body rod modification protein FlgD